MNTAIDDERDRLVNYLEFSGVTARYLKINTSLTDTNSTFLLNDLQNDVQVFQYPDKEYEIPTTSGYLHSDPTPLSGGLSNWFSYASVAVNEQDRSVGVDLGIKVPVDAIELWGAENSTTISKNNLSLYKSDDNENYSEISEWTYSTSNENGKIKIRLSFPSTTTRYLKVHNNLNNDSATFVLVNMQDDIKAFSSVEVAGNFQRFPDGRGSEGGFINLNDGTLAMAVDHFVDGSADTSQSELGWYKSTDGGESWRDIETLLENEGVRNTMHPALIRLKNGDLGMAYQVQDGDENTQIYFRISKDEGKSWGERTLITSATEKGYNIMPSGNKILRFPSGRIIVPVAFSPNLSGAFDDRMYAQVWYSDDEGAMWSRSSGIYLPNGALEPVVTRLNDGNLLMTLRTRREGKMYKSYSTDDGVTWSKPEEMGLDSPSSANTVQVIPATGDVLLVWNNVYSTSNNPREPLTMAISRDNGTTWHMIQNLFEGAYSTWPQIAFYGRKVFFGFGNGPNVESAVRVVDIDTLYHSVEGREVSIATIQQFINTYEENNQLKGPIVHQLENRLAQAKHHYEKGSITQATKHMQDFVKHLKNKGLQKFIDQEAKAVLETEANHLINSWSE